MNGKLSFAFSVEIAAFHVLQTEAGLEGIPILIKVLG